MDSAERTTPAMLYAGVVGAVLVVAGIIGFFYNAEFTTDESVRDAVFGVFDVNGWHNIVHILTGVLGLLAYGAGVYAARTYALALGVVYLVVAAWGFVVGDGDSILEHRPGQHRGQHPPPAARSRRRLGGLCHPGGEAVRPAAQT